jgi:hypothetical protein
MARIFTTLSAIAVVLLLSNVLVGLWLGDMGQSSADYEAARQIAHEMESNTAAANAELAEARAEKDRRLQALSDMRRRLQPHIWLGIIASLVTILVNCISVTYFIGTGRWCREVVDAYGLAEELALRSRQLKRRSFPFALLGMLTTVGIAALGAASDPGAGLVSPASWVAFHAGAAMLGTVVIGSAFYVQANAVDANFELIREILAETERIRSSPREAEPAVTDEALMKQR